VVCSRLGDPPLRVNAADTKPRGFVSDGIKLNRVGWYADGCRMKVQGQSGQGQEHVPRGHGRGKKLEQARWCGWPNWVPVWMFGLAVLGTWLGVQLRIRPSETPLYLAGRTKMPGYWFQAVPLGQQVAEKLATTRLLNGHFFDARSNRVSVFQADWKAGQVDGSALGHTPEICWVSGGFRTICLGEPSQVFVELGGQRVPFRCRILTYPGLPTPEITLWAACIDGRWDDVLLGPLADMRTPDTTLRSYVRDVGRTLSTRWAFVRRVALQPFPVSGPKQFVRLSLPVTDGWPAALADLENFAQAWLVPVAPNVAPTYLH
jgi:hypothetical protein